MKAHIGAQSLRSNPRTLGKLRVVFNQWIVSVYFEVKSNKKYLLFYGILTGRYLWKCIKSTYSFSIYQNTKALIILINFDQTIVFFVCKCRQHLYISVYSLYWCKYKQWHSILAFNLNVTSRFGDLLVIFEIVRNEQVSPENFLQSDFIQGFEISPTIYQFIIQFFKHSFSIKKAFIKCQCLNYTLCPDEKIVWLRKF